MDLKHGFVDGDVDLQVIEFDTADLPRALIVLAELVTATGARVQNLWLGAPTSDDRDQLWFVTVPTPPVPPAPPTPAPARIPFPPPPPPAAVAVLVPPMFAEV